MSRKAWSNCLLLLAAANLALAVTPAIHWRFLYVMLLLLCLTLSIIARRRMI